MFGNLRDKFREIIDKINNRGILTEDIIDTTVRELRISLLEADVALPVVKDFSAKLKEKLLGKQVLNSMTPAQTVMQNVYNELVALLGDSGEISNIKRGKILMLGLQGAGKTTSSAKLANLLQSKYNRKVLLVSLDTYRPAAIEQLRKLANKNDIDFFENFEQKDTPIEIARKALNTQNKYDIIIYDTAGRSSIDEKMMREIADLKALISPSETFLVIDSMMGQDAVNTAKSFNETVTLTGLVLTRADGDARGGAIISAKYVTNCQVKFICNGEKINDIEQFYPERIASKILDQGDIMTFLEKANEMELPQIKRGMFDLCDMEGYLTQLKKLGGMGGLMKYLPVIKKLRNHLNTYYNADKAIDHQIAIIRSMTIAEKRDPKILNASRRRRIAAGCGQEVSAVNKLVKQFEHLRTALKKSNNPQIRRYIFGQ
ncbi:MAG: signal recognition particle protein [Alphaproteobacteria bacterium]|nr:signal recognition particle protein [Alphaproteobacteria bacterium]